MSKFYRLSLVVLLGAIVFLVWDGCMKDAQLSAYKQKMSKFRLKEQVFKETIDKNGLRIASQEQIILSQEDALTSDVLMLNDFKKVSSQVQLSTRTQINSVFIPFETITIDTQVVYTCFDRNFKLLTKDYSIFGTSLKDGVLLDSLYFDAKSTITIGYKSSGFLKKAQPIVEVKYDNPYMRTTAMQNVVIQEDLKWYDKKKSWFGIGIGMGLVGTYLIMK